MRLGIDATNIGIGGGVTHLKEILNHLPSYYQYGSISKIIIFSSDKVLAQLPKSRFIDKCAYPALNKGLIQRIIFQVISFDKELFNKCDVLFSITGDYFGKFRPIIGMSRNMLLYERKIWREIKHPKEILKFWLNFQKQKLSFKNSAGIIFISNYAKSYVSGQIDLKGKQTKVIHHGVSNRFLGKVKTQRKIKKYSFEKPFRFVYISTVHVYKNQWNLVEAVGRLREKGYPIELDLVGKVIFEPAGLRLTRKLIQVDPNRTFIRYHGHVPYEKIEQYYMEADGIIFASTCENMPNTLIESMASGVPILCSDKQPMPEFLKNNGFYFNAYNVDSIAYTIEEFLQNPKTRKIMAQNNIKEIKQYNWTKTTHQTFNFIFELYKQYYNVY